MLRDKESSKQKEYEIVLLDELVPQDHMLRKIDAAVDFSFIHDLCKDLYSPNIGRPAIEPELLFRMLFLGYLYGIKSETRLAQEVNENIAFKWFLELKLAEKGPDHATISANRVRRFRDNNMVCAFIVMKCEGFSQITDLMDYLDNNRIIAHYCGFNIMEPLPSYWTYDRCLRQLDNGALKAVMADLVRQLYELGIVDASFVGLDSTPVMANTKQNNPKSFAKNKFSKENHPKSDPDCALGVHSASNQHNERRYEFYWGYKSHVLVDCISGLPLYELTTPGNIADSAVAAEILAAADQTISLKGCAFLADKGYDVKSIPICLFAGCSFRLFCSSL